MEVVMAIDKSFGDSLMDKLLEAREQKKLKNMTCYFDNLQRNQSLEWSRRYKEGNIDRFCLLHRSSSDINNMLDDDALTILVDDILKYFGKCFLLIQLEQTKTITAASKERYELQRRLVPLFLFKNVQVAFVTSKDHMLGLAVDLSKAVCKETTLEAHIESGKVVKVNSDDMIGLRKLWMSQVEVVYKYSKKKKCMPAFNHIPSAKVMMDAMRENENILTEDMVLQQEDLPATRPNQTFLKHMTDLLKVNK